MEKVKVEYEKLYYGFPVVLISYYDQEGKPSVTTLSSSYIFIPSNFYKSVS